MKSNKTFIVVMMQLFSMVVHCSDYQHGSSRRASQSDQDNSFGQVSTVPAGVNEGDETMPVYPCSALYRKPEHNSNQVFDRSSVKAFSKQNNYSKNDLSSVTPFEQQPFESRFFSAKDIASLYRLIVESKAFPCAKKITIDNSNFRIFNKEDLQSGEDKMPHDTVAVFGSQKQQDEMKWKRIDISDFEGSVVSNAYEGFIFITDEKNRKKVQSFLQQSKNRESS